MEIRYVNAPCPLCDLELHLDMSDLSDSPDGSMTCEGCAAPIAFDLVAGRPVFVVFHEA